MTMTTKPVPYDVLEAPGHIIFALDAPAFADGLSRIAVIPGHGVEAFGIGGQSIRFGNLHPRLLGAAVAKSVLVATLNGANAVIAGLPDDELGTAPERWFPRAFYWYLNAPHGDARELAARPLARLLLAAPCGIVAAASGLPSVGPAIGLCMHMERMLALPTGRSWTAVRPLLTVENALLEGVGGYPATDDVEESVMAAFHSRLRPRQDTPPAPRTQLAVVVGA